MPSLPQIEGRVIRLVFVSPEQAIPELKRRFPDLENLLVDVTGCQKRLASDVITSYTARGIDHVCHFQLADKVFSSEWRKSGQSMLYHDLKAEVPYYQYDDFSMPGTTIETLNRLRAQGKAIKILIVIDILLGVAIFVLINAQQTALALISAFVLTVVTILGFLDASLSLFDRFRK
jgi:hypothetical protein